MGTYRERRERRAARREEWAEGREAKAGREFAQVKQTADAIPLGQPILVGHHSEKRARRDQKKIRRGVRRGPRPSEDGEAPPIEGGRDSGSA